MYTNGKSLSSDTDFYKRQQDAIRQAKAADEYSRKRGDSTPSSAYSENLRRPFEEPKPQTEEKYQDEEKHQDSESDYETFKREERGLPGIKSSLSHLLRNIQQDDILILGLLFLLFNENKEDDFLMIFILAILFFT